MMGLLPLPAGITVLFFNHFRNEIGSLFTSSGISFSICNISQKEMVIFGDLNFSVRGLCPQSL
jgi:hypothetical protein